MENFESYYFLLEEMRKQATEQIRLISDEKVINLIDNEFYLQWIIDDKVKTGLAVKLDCGKLIVNSENKEEIVEYSSLTAECLMWLIDIVK